MSPRRRKAEDADVFAAMVRVMLRIGPAELTLRAIAAEPTPIAVAKRTALSSSASSRCAVPSKSRAISAARSAS